MSEVILIEFFFSILYEWSRKDRKDMSTYHALYSNLNIYNELSHAVVTASSVW